ncbi:MAG: DUF6163 family protein [Lentilitoribacter sp.]
MVDNNSISLEQMTQKSSDASEGIHLLYNVFLSIVALACVAGTVKYWAMLMGITDGGTLRFDIAPLHWRLAATTLALLLPLTALGVWFQTAFGLWGWVLVTFIQYLMHAVLPNWFGADPLNLIFSGAVVVLFLVFQTIFYFKERKRLQEEGL